MTGSNFTNEYKQSRKWHHKFFNHKGAFNQDLDQYKKQIVQVYFNWIVLAGCGAFIFKIIKNRTQKLVRNEHYEETQEAP